MCITIHKLTKMDSFYQLVCREFNNMPDSSEFKNVEFTLNVKVDYLKNGESVSKSMTMVDKTFRYIQIKDLLNDILYYS